MRKKFYKYCAIMTAGAALIGSLYTGQADAAAPRRENFSTTCQILRNAAISTAAVDHCKLHVTFSAVNNDDRVIYSAHNIIAAYNNGSKAFIEGVIEKATFAAGKETAIAIPYYIQRNGSSYTCFIKSGEGWKSLPFPILDNLVKECFGLQEFFQDNKTAECLNETDKGRTTVFRADLVPITNLFFSLISAADLLPAPDLGPGYQTREKPTEVFVRQDYTQGIISDINVDVTQFITGYLKQRPKALTADEQQAALRKVLEKGSMNFHISVYGTDKPVEFHDIYESLYTGFGLDIPQELLSEKQRKDREKAAPVFR